MSNKKTQKSNTSNTTIILFLIFLILLTGSIFWYIKIIDGAQIIQDNKKAHSQELKDSQMISEIKNRQQQAEEIIKYLDSLYVSEDNAVAFIEYIESLANDSEVDLNIQNFKIDETEDVDYNKMNMNINARGSWSQINRFVIMMENLNYSVHIDEFSLKVNQEESRVVWESEFKLSSLTK
jgi:Tfp pilus assembly protein PilO